MVLNPEHYNSKYSITAPLAQDVRAIGIMHLKAWMETYIRPELGITGKVIQEKVGYIASQSGADFRLERFAEQEVEPDKHLYRVVRQGSRVVGFLHGNENEETVDLSALYLLDECKGTGIAQELMAEFLDWSNSTKPKLLEVVSYNQRAINFYKKSGFRPTGVESVFLGVFPYIEMEHA